MNFIYNYPNKDKNYDEFKKELFNDYYYNYSVNVLMYDTNKLILKIDENFNDLHLLNNSFNKADDYLNYLFTKLNISRQNDLLNYDYGFIKVNLINGSGGKESVATERVLVKDLTYMSSRNTYLNDFIYSFKFLDETEMNYEIEFMENLTNENYGTGKIYNTLLFLEFIDADVCLNFLKNYKYKYKSLDSLYFSDTKYLELGYNYSYLGEQNYSNTLYYNTDKVSVLSYYLFDYFGLTADSNLIIEKDNIISELFDDTVHLNNEINILRNNLITKEDLINDLKNEILNLKNNSNKVLSYYGSVQAVRDYTYIKPHSIDNEWADDSDKLEKLIESYLLYATDYIDNYLEVSYLNSDDVPYVVSINAVRIASNALMLARQNQSGLYHEVATGNKLSINDSWVTKAIKEDLTMFKKIINADKTKKEKNINTVVRNYKGRGYCGY